MRAVLTWLLYLLATTAAVVVAYEWFDRPIALLMHRGIRSDYAGVWQYLTYIRNPLVPLALFIFVVLGLYTLVTRSLRAHQAAAFVSSLAVIMAEASKEQLKFLFGRTWPETWAGNNPSFIRDGVYGFHIMHGGGGYNSFPSGHMATTCAVLCVLWFWYPRLRWLFAIGGFAVGAGLVVTNYHFLSDVIAGAFLGISFGWIAATVWTGGQRGIPSANVARPVKH
jgi:membrane-associated phospholipid phosphatase